MDGRGGGVQFGRSAMVQSKPWAKSNPATCADGGLGPSAVLTNTGFSLRLSVTRLTSVPTSGDVGDCTGDAVALSKSNSAGSAERVLLPAELIARNNSGLDGSCMRQVLQNWFLPSIAGTVPYASSSSSD